MASAAWKIPRRWRGLSLCDRTALYPALYLRWSGLATVIGRDIPPGQWDGASLRVLISDGPLAEDERELMLLTAARGEDLLLLPQAGLAEVDRAFIAEIGCRIGAWTDEGPLASAPPWSGGRQVLTFQGCAARAAEDLVLTHELSPDSLPPRGGGIKGGGPRGLGNLDDAASDRRPLSWDDSAGPARPPSPGPSPSRGEGSYLIVVVETAEAFLDIWPALQREALRTGGRLIATSEIDAELERIAAETGVTTIPAADPGLLTLIVSARIVLCAHPNAAPDSPRPGQWVRSALYQGVPVIAASHPSIDGLAHLCVLDDWERGLALYGRLPLERLKASARAQADLDARLDPDQIAGSWRALAEAPRERRAMARSSAPEMGRTPLLLVLIDIHQDLDVLLPVLLALRARGEVRLRIALTDWLVVDSQRVLNILTAHGFTFDVYPREEVRRGDAPLLGGVDGVLAGAETNVRAHKSGHTLVSRAKARGAPTFTLQHGFENIGLTYRDELHTEAVRFAAETIFTWCAEDDLAPWIAPETRASVVAMGSPKTAPPPAAPTPLNQGFWTRSIGVFENLHWARFSDVYRERFIEDLQEAAAARPDTLFLIKPHHAGRWMSRNRERIAESANLVVIDPTDSAWEPHTAPALIAGVDRVLTTPSTVALDAARTGRPVAVLGYDLDLPLYTPLPIVRGLQDLDRFLDEAADAALPRNEAFLARARLPGRADHRIAAHIAAALRQRVSRGQAVTGVRRKRPVKA